MKKAVISLSGGMDSTCLLMELLSNDYEVKAYSFDYGQKHKIELEKVQNNIKFLQDKGFRVTHQIINLRDVFSDSNSALHEGGGEIPHDHYAAENQKVTVVENRNVIFSAIIYGKALAWANKLNEHVYITLGIHAGDHCFTRDTKILTPAGLKTIDELKIGDKVYSYDEHDNLTVVDYVENIVEVGEAEEILNIDTSSGYIRVTPDHKFYRISLKDFNPIKGYTKKMELCKAAELKEGDLLLTSKNLPSDNNQDEELFDVSIFADDNFKITEDSVYIKKTNVCPRYISKKNIVKLMAWYITEGWTSNPSNPTESHYKSSFSQSLFQNIENCEDIQEMIIESGMPINMSYSSSIDECGRPKEITYNITGILSNMVKTAGKNSSEKNIPKWLKDILLSSSDMRKIFIMTMISGDGHYDKLSGMYSYISKSVKLIEDLSFLIKLEGFAVKIHTNSNDCYVLNFGSKCKKTGLVNFGDGSITKIKSISSSNTPEKVYDITVKHNHNFFAGSLGNLLVHNCIYPDCRPESQETAEHLYKISNWGSEKVDYIAPFVKINKSEVLKHGVDAMRNLNFTDDEVNFILKNTHTCYDVNENGESCGECGSCRERLEAFEENHMKDPVTYRK